MPPIKHSNLAPKSQIKITPTCERETNTSVTHRRTHMQIIDRVFLANNHIDVLQLLFGSVLLNYD